MAGTRESGVSAACMLGRVPASSRTRERKRGLFPIVGAVFSLMPDPVLGGATLLMFGTVAAAGIRIISSQEIGRKETLVLAVSLSLGLGVELMPDVLQQAPEAIRSIFSSGITTGGLTAIIANIVIRVKE